MNYVNYIISKRIIKCEVTVKNQKRYIQIKHIRSGFLSRQMKKKMSQNTVKAQHSKSWPERSPETLIFFLLFLSSFLSSILSLSSIFMTHEINVGGTERLRVWHHSTVFAYIYLNLISARDETMQEIKEEEK